MASFFGRGEVLRTRYRLDRCADYTISRPTSKDAVSCKDVPFGDPENKFLHFDPVFAKKTHFLVDFRRDKISAQNGL